MEARIRRFEARDEIAVADLWHRAGRAAYTYLPTWQAFELDHARAVFRDAIAATCEVWVGESNGVPVAFLALNGSYVDRLYVDPPVQSLGWSTRLLRTPRLRGNRLRCESAAGIRAGRRVSMDTRAARSNAARHAAVEGASEMAGNKTRPTNVDPNAFLDGIESARRREDGHSLLALMQEITGELPVMWGPSIVGFGRQHYRYESGREGEMPLTGFSPRKQSLVLYVGSGMKDDSLMARLGKHRRGAGCLYINKLADVDPDALRTLIERSVAASRGDAPTPG